MCRHGFYELACRELGVPYRLVDATGADWRRSVVQSKCDAFAVWPYVQTAAGKRMYDERVQVMEKELGLNVFPGAQALWLYESKSRTAEWLRARGFPMPATWIFRDKETALQFVRRRAQWPLVYKTDLGAEAAGVRFLPDAAAACALIRRLFGKGLALTGQRSREREQGMALFQEHIPDAREWRAVRIGNTFFAHRKCKRGAFHSGSKKKAFDTPPRAALDLLRAVADSGPFESMSIDMLEDAQGRLLIVEMHAYFGCGTPHVMAIEGVPGRYRYEQERDEYRFEPGDFNRNQSCNLRVERILETWGTQDVRS